MGRSDELWEEREYGVERRRREEDMEGRSRRTHGGAGPGVEDGEGEDVSLLGDGLRDSACAAAW